MVVLVEGRVTDPLKKDPGEEEGSGEFIDLLFQSGRCKDR